MNQNIKPKSLFQHRRVRLVISVTLLLALGVTWKIIVTDNLTFVANFGAENAQIVMDSFKLPIGIIAAGLSLLLLFATQHRSEQTVEQINITNKANANLLAQNTLKNYYDSIADFEKYVDNNFHSEVIEIKNKRQLYKLFFPENSYKNVTPYTTEDIYIQEVNKFTSNFDEIIKVVLSTKESNTPKLKLELIINYFIYDIKNTYSIHLTDKAFLKNSKANDELAKLTKDVRQLLIFCFSYTPVKNIPTIEGSYAFSRESWLNFKGYIKENHPRNIEDFTVKSNELDGFGGKIKLEDNEERELYKGYNKPMNFLNTKE
jgi:hypothetical protein